MISFFINFYYQKILQNLISVSVYITLSENGVPGWN